MSEGLTDIGRAALFEGLRARIDAGGAACIEFFADEQRVNLLGVVPLRQPCGTSAPDGLSLSASSAQASGTGVPGFGRLKNGAGEEILSGRCAAGGIFTLALAEGETVYPGGDLIFPGGVIGFA